VQIRDSLCFRIDNFRDFQRLHAVARAVVVVAAGTVSFVEDSIERNVCRGIVQLRRLAQQYSTEAHLDPIERFTQCRWCREIGCVEADFPSYL